MKIGSDPIHMCKCTSPNLDNSLKLINIFPYPISNLQIGPVIFTSRVDHTTITVSVLDKRKNKPSPFSRNTLPQKITKSKVH